MSGGFDFIPIARSGTPEENGVAILAALTGYEKEREVNISGFTVNSMPEVAVAPAYTFGLWVRVD